MNLKRLKKHKKVNCMVLKTKRRKLNKPQYKIDERGV